MELYIPVEINDKIIKLNIGLYNERRGLEKELHKRKSSYSELLMGLRVEDVYEGPIVDLSVTHYHEIERMLTLNE